MNIKNLYVALCSVVVLAGMHDVRAVDSNASVVQLRTSCTESGATLNNCFTDIAILNNWIFYVRSPVPSATSPVLVEIGPGQFNGSFVCDGSGYVTLRGAGRKNTTITAGAYPIATNNCQNMTFIGMTLRSNGLGIKGTGGSTVWDDIELETGGAYAWFENELANSNCPFATPGTHYWYNSRIVNTIPSNHIGSAVTYGAQCDETWFFGSEIGMVTNTLSGTYYAVQTANNKKLVGRGVVHIYGGNVRAISNNVSSTATLGAIQATQSGSVHVHGTGIDVLAKGTNPIIALSAITSGEIHGNETAYNLDTGVGGSITRVNKDSTGHIHAPYMWETHPNVPFANTGKTFVSVTGFDTAVVTTNSLGATDHPHMVIYDSSCTTSKWFDTTTNQCR